MFISKWSSLTSSGTDAFSSVEPALERMYVTDNEIIIEDLLIKTDQVQHKIKSRGCIICESQQVYVYCKSIWATSTMVFACLCKQLLKLLGGIILLYQYVV